MHVDQTKSVPWPYFGRMIFEKNHPVPYGAGTYRLPERTAVLFGVNDDGAGELFIAKVEGASDLKGMVTHGEGSINAMNAALLKHYRNGLTVVR